MRHRFCFALAFVFALSAAGEILPHALFADGAVLQRDMPVPVWGFADTDKAVTVEFCGQTKTAEVRDGKWSVVLDPVPAGGPFKMVITGQSDQIIHCDNVLVGEVWIASGQSNMRFPLMGAKNAEEVIAAAHNDNIRFVYVNEEAKNEVRDNLPLRWYPCEPEVVGQLSAVAYYFARDLEAALDVPVGIIQAAVGGSPADAWTDWRVLEAEFPEIVENYKKAVERHPAAMEKHIEKLKKFAEARKENPGLRPPHPPMGPDHIFRPAGLYRGMIRPLQPYAIRGAIWYQGEGNASRAYQYRRLFPAMIHNWREDWDQGDFPFLFVQLAPYRKIEPEPVESMWAELREAQLMTAQTVPNTAMAVITDAGEEDDIHPRWKEPVGGRLATAALGMVYGKDVVPSGPVYKKMKVKDGKAVLSFDFVGDGLEARGGELTGFAICGEDHKFHNAEAKIKGKKVVVWSDEVEDPVAVRFGWANYPVVNLWNKNGLPATPFRTDDFPTLTGPKE